MRDFKPRGTAASGPEHKIQNAVLKMFKTNGWYTIRMPGTTKLSGIPDLYTTHPKYGARWVEIKRPNMKGSKFTPAQLDRFPKICANGSGIWILTDATDIEYRKLFKSFNWRTYLKTAQSRHYRIETISTVPSVPATKSTDKPEHKIQTKIIQMLLMNGWYVVRMPGSTILSGIPDLYATHSKYGARWIEVKRPKMEGSKFTSAQLERFPVMCKNGSGIWILTGNSEDEYKKLFKAYNWWKYLNTFK
jgi:Holliday junction resolvase